MWKQLLFFEMSEDQLQAFQEAVKADAGLQEQLKAASDMDAVVAIAKAAGFVISTEDLKRAQPEISKEEEELAGVSGGFQRDRDWEGVIEDDLSWW